MTYQETLKWMFAQLPMYQNKGKTAFKKDLNNIIKLSKHLKHPENKFKSLHIAGTNGKGSVSHMLASILQEAGYKTGLYTSPHLKDFRERIKINGAPIRKNCVINFIKRNKEFLQNNSLSFFEMTVGIAFEYFAKKKVDIAIIEVGLGGRLDSTNIISPEVSVITNISFDHTQMLGNSLRQIAVEKAGIIKHKTPVVIGEPLPETEEVFKQIANKNNSKIYFVNQQVKPKYNSDLQGNYQQKNINTVLKSVELLQKKGYKISEINIKNGLKNVVKNTGLHGRWEVVQKKPKIILDTAHNEAGLKFVIEQLLQIKHKQLHIVLSVVNDKDLDKILPLFPKNAVYYFSKAQIPRGLSQEILKNTAKKYGLMGDSYHSVKQAFNKAKNNSNPDDIIFVGGSTFTVAEIL